jgi:tRNA nucleotidyltransferase (CCA-adding enzyme)
MNTKIKIPENVKLVLNLLEENNHEAVVVGGSIRDALLGIEAKDWDIATSAFPDEVMSIFKFNNYQVIPTGLKHGTVTTLVNNQPIEITTYRTDGIYEDGRRPSDVKFTMNLKDDLARRDFTFNAIAYNDRLGLIDYFGEIDDLKNGIVKCVGDPNERFGEDKLRILRAIRFAAKYNFKIDKQIIDVMYANNDISNLSQERIQSEFNQILSSEKPSKWIRLMREKWLLQQIIPEIIYCFEFNQYHPYHDKNVFEHILTVVDNVPAKLELRLAALFHDIAKPKVFTVDDECVGHFYGHADESAIMTEEIMKRMKYSNEQIEKVKTLVSCHMDNCDFLNKRALKCFINKVGVDLLDDLFSLKIADRIGCKPPVYFEDIFRTKFACEKILNEQQLLDVKDLVINGYDLMEIGVPKGKLIGEILNYLLDEVLSDEGLNQRDVLLRLANDKYNELKEVL